MKSCWMRRSVVTGLAAIAALAGPSGSVRSVTAAPASLLATESFVDPANDNPKGLAPDMTRVDVTLATDGNLTIRIETPNRTSQLPTDAVVMYMNTDLDPSTGTVGADYRIEAFGGEPGVFLARWGGSSWDRVSSVSFSGEFSGGVTARMRRSDIGAPNGFSFFAVSFSNGLEPDYAPDGAPSGGRLTAKLDGSGTGVNPPAPLTGSELSKLVARVKSGVIRIETTTCEGRAVGTGMLVGPALVATVEHVVDGARTIVLKSGRKKLGTATIIGRDRSRDLALLKVSKAVPGYRFRLARRSADIGESVAVLGYPLGLPLTLTRGTVSGLNRTIRIDGVPRRGLVQTDAAVNRGNSGGPLISIETGEVIGLVDLLAAEANGIAFAVSSRLAAPLLERWAAKPRPVRPARCT